MTAQNALLTWCLANLDGYKSVRVNNFSTSWRDGKALLAILNRHRPSLISFNDSLVRDNKENLRNAFNFAELEFGVAPILEPEDLDQDQPDEKSIINYLSMLFNIIPNVPVHPDELILETKRNSNMEEYSMICRSLMRWLKDSILIMDNRNVPDTRDAIKASLNNVKTFRLEEYASRLKEKKKLVQLSNELILISSQEEKLNIESELKSIEKVWQKFDHYIQLRESLLEKCLKKFENLQNLTSKIDKTYDQCEKRLNEIEKISKNLIPINNNNERLDEQLDLCDQDLRKLFKDCENLKEEEHLKADSYFIRINQLEKRYSHLKSNNLIKRTLNSSSNCCSSNFNIYNNKSNETNKMDGFQLKSYLNWIDEKTNQIQTETFPNELDEIENEIFKKNNMIKEIEMFRENYLKDYQEYQENLNEKNSFEDSKYNFEIAFNLLFNATNHRLKCLINLNDYVKSVNEELEFLEFREEIELNRDWSVLEKLNSINLRNHKQKLDDDINKRDTSHIQLVLHKGNALISDKHPASNIIQTHMEALTEHLEWIRQLSSLLAIHIQSLTDYECFNSECKQLNESLNQLKKNLLHLLSNSKTKNLTESITRTEDFKVNLLNLKLKIDKLILKSKSLIPLRSRKLKLKPPFNVCKSLITFKNDQININKDEECIIENNSDLAWKLVTPNGQVLTAPSVYFQLVPNNLEFDENVSLLNKRCDDLFKEAQNCQRQFKKDNLLAQMNSIKNCELDEYQQRKQSKDKEFNLNLLLDCIKLDIDKLVKESNETDDLRLIFEGYDKCLLKLKELDEKAYLKDERIKFEKEMNSDINLLEEELKLLDEKLSHLEHSNKLEIMDHKQFIDNLIAQFQDFEKNDLKKMESETSKCYNKLETNKQQQRSSSLNRSNDVYFRQKIDNIKSQTSSIRNDTNTYFENLNLVKTLINSVENANKWLTRIEKKLTTPDIILEQSTLSNLSLNIQRTANDLNETQILLKSKQEIIGKIRELCDIINTNKTRLKYEISNLIDILDLAEEIKNRYRNIFVQISDRGALLNELNNAYDQYKFCYLNETKWISLLTNQIEDFKIQQSIYKQQKQLIKLKYQPNSKTSTSSSSSMDNEINDLKNSFDPIAQIFTELGFKSTKVDELNDFGIQLIRFLKRYIQLITEAHNQTTINNNSSNQTGKLYIANEIRQELNNFNREYASLLSEFNQRIKKLTNTIVKSDKHFSVHIKFQNAEPLIEKFNLDLFERYDLAKETILNSTKINKTIKNKEANNNLKSDYINTTTNNNNIHYYYYDTVNKDYKDINTININDLKQNNSIVMEPRLVYPIAFIDAVNKKQLDLETGYFRDPKSGSFSMRLNDAIKLNLLNPKSVYFNDSNLNKTFDLNEAIKNGILIPNNINNNNNRIIVNNNKQPITLADALKTGFLKIGNHHASPLNNGGIQTTTTKTTLSNSQSNCSITSETQSMSVRSIKDPSTGEFLMPTEAIKRKLLDPYKGQFYNPLTGERLPISEAIQKGFVIVEILADTSTTTTTANVTPVNGKPIQPPSESNIVSTSLIRETKSYHLLGVYDPLKNDEITIKEAIACGILDRQKGLYIHPITKESFSISDAINKGVIRARILAPQDGSGVNGSVSTINNTNTNKTLTHSTSEQHIPYQSLVSTNRFEENKSYTISGAIDSRTGKRVTLSQAIKEGIIDAKNGSYINLKTNEAISLNKAIEANLVLTEQASNNGSIHPPPPINNKREIITLNIESVKDPRNDQNLTVSEAIYLGLLDKQTLSYYHPISNECLSLNKAYQKGYIIGYYTDAYQHTTTIKQQQQQPQSFFIISVFDPVNNRSMTLDQAIQCGLFDYSRALYIHPITKELFGINDSVRKGLIDAQIYEPQQQQQQSSKQNVETSLPIGDFGIDKRITSMRTKFNADGSSVLQIDIESTMPTRGLYEIDEIEVNTGHAATSTASSHQTYSSSEFRQVVDINSVHRVNRDPAEVNRQQQQLIQIVQPIHNIKQEKSVVYQQINKEFNLDSKRVEKVLDDVDGVVRINVDTNRKHKEIPERKVNKIEKIEQIERETLVIDDDIDNRKFNRPLNIDGQTHVVKKEFNINSEHQVSQAKIDFQIAQKNVQELNRKLIEIENQKLAQINKRPEAHIVESHHVVNRSSVTSSFVDIDEKHNIQQNKLVIDIENNKQQKRLPPPVETIIDERKPRLLYEDIIDERITFELNQQEEEDDDDGFFDEWTEVFTITIRNIRYKIIWVYDPIKNERIPLREAVKREIINLDKLNYHNLKTSHTSSISEAVDDGLIGVEQDNSALTIKANGITYTIYWVWDPVKHKRIAPKKALERGVLNVDTLIYRNYSNGQTINLHEAIHLRLIGASDDLTNIDEELHLDINKTIYKIAWVKDSRSKEKLKPREALRRGLLDLNNNFYKKYETNEILTILEAIEQDFIGVSNTKLSKETESDSDSEEEIDPFNKNDSLVSLDDEELTIKTKTAIYVITGLLHPETQKEIKVSEAIESGILDKEQGSYRDFKTNVVYEVGEAINEGFVFATVTDLLQDESASTEYIREEIKKFIVKSVIDPRTKERVGGLQAQAAGILNYAQGMYSNPDTLENIPIGEAIERGYIEVSLQEETSKEEFDAEVVTDTLMDRTITNYRITGVIDPFTNEMISASEAVHRQIIDTETNAYVDSTSHSDEPIPIKEAVRRNLIKAQVTERHERKPLGLSLQNAIRLGLFNIENGKFKDPYSNNYTDLNYAIEKGHINPNGSAVAESSSGSMTLNEAFTYGIVNKRTGIIDRHRLNMFKGRIVESKIFKWNFEDAVKCGLVNLKTGKYKHQQSGELLSIKDAIGRGLIDGEATIIENPSNQVLMTLKQALDTIKIDENGNVLDPASNKCIITLEDAFNHRKIFSAFDENTGEIFLSSISKIVPFEKAMRKNKMDKSVRIFDPKSNKDLSLNDAIERAIIDKTSGMVIDPKGGGLLSIKEAVKRGILSVTGAPVVTGHHDSEKVETPVITSRKTRHSLLQFDEVNEVNGSNSIKSKTTTQNSSTTKSPKKTKQKTPIVYDTEYMNSEFIRENPNILNDQSTITSIKMTNEEHRKRIRGNDVTETIKADFKETVIKPGELPVVTSKSNTNLEYKSKLPVE